MSTITERFVEALMRAKKRLFHFTDARNIPSIQKNGLMPTRTIIERGLDVITGGDAVSLLNDRTKGLDSHISLSFCRSHPMAHAAIEQGRIETLRIIKICPSVLLRPGVMLADQIATSNSAKIAHPDQMIQLMDLVAIYDRLDWSTEDGQKRRAAAEKWEALIPDIINPDLILGL